MNIVEITALFLKIIGLFSLLYMAMITLYCGFFPAFSWFWAGSGLAGISTGCLLQRFSVINSPWLSFLSGMILGVIGIGVLTLLGSFFILFSAGNRKGKEGADYLIVLGAKVKGSIPTKALWGRIQKSFEYLEENPDTKVVLTGGKGPGEEISEASCMERELLAMGIAGERILKEEKSTTTLENIAFASEMIPNRKAKILIVTSDFHVKRGVAIARKAGYKKIEGLGAKTAPVMRLHYETREILSWIHYGLHGIRKER